MSFFKFDLILLKKQLFIYFKVFIALTFIVSLYYCLIAPLMSMSTGKSTHILVKNNENFPVIIKIKSFYLFNREKIIPPGLVEDFVIYPGLNRPIKFQISSEKENKIIKKLKLPIFPGHALLIWSSPQNLITQAINIPLLNTPEMENFINKYINTAQEENEIQALKFLNKLLIPVDALDVVFGYDTNLSLFFTKKLPKGITLAWEKHPLILPWENGEWKNKKHHISLKSNKLEWTITLPNSQKVTFIKKI